MKPIIDYTVFVGQINIPGTDKIPVQELITELIEEEQAEFLRKALGNDAYWEFKTAVEASEQEVDPVPLPVVYELLLNGEELKEYNFVGLKNLFAKYMYVYYLTKTATQTTTIGEVSTKKENSLEARPIYKQVDVWNKMVDEYKTLDQFIAQHQLVYIKSKEFSCYINWLNI